MVSTQNTFLPATRLPPILGTSPPPKSTPVQRVLSPPAIAYTPPAFDPKNLQRLLNRANNASADVLSGLSYNGNTPNSIPSLIAMGAKRNHTTNTDTAIDETAAFHNDVAYFKVLLQAREKHRAAMREKLEALRNLRAKQRKICRKRTTSKPSPALVAAALARAVGRANEPNENNTTRDDKWRRLAVHQVCVSPMSTDVESEVSSHFDDADTDVSDDKLVSDGKPVIHRA